MTVSTDRVWMTDAALRRLEDELATLNQTADIDDAGRARVLELRDVIRRAEVSAKPDDGLVEPGMVITVRFSSDGSEETFLLGSRMVLGENGDLEVSSPTSPLGAAINGRIVGDAVEYTAPNGAVISVVITSAVPFEG